MWCNWVWLYDWYYGKQPGLGGLIFLLIIRKGFLRLQNCDLVMWDLSVCERRLYVFVCVMRTLLDRICLCLCITYIYCYFVFAIRTLYAYVEQMFLYARQCYIWYGSHVYYCYILELIVCYQLLSAVSIKVMNTAFL